MLMINRGMVKTAPNFTKYDGVNAVVFFNGVEQCNVVTADTGEGFIIQHCRDDKDNLVITKDGRIKRTRKTGSVSVIAKGQTFGEIK